MLNIYVNNQPKQVDPTASLYEVLLENKYIEEHIAIAINNQFIPRKQFANTQLCEGDRIDVIVPMQGG